MVEFRRNRARFYKGRSDAAFFDFELYDMGLRIQGDAYIPKNMVYGAVFIHGLGPDHRLFPDYIRGLISKDTGFIKFSLPGNGQDTVDPSPGLSEKYGRYMVRKARSIFNTDKVILAGHSFGGYLAARAAAWARNPEERVDGLFLMSPVFDLREILLKEYPSIRYLESLSYLEGGEYPAFINTVSQIISSNIGHKIGDKITDGWQLSGTREWSRLHIYDFNEVLCRVRNMPSPDDFLGDIDCPVLMVYGVEDELVPTEQFIAYEESLNRYGKSLESAKIPGGKHNLFSDPGNLKEVSVLLKKWASGLTEPSWKDKGAVKRLTGRAKDTMRKYSQRAFRTGYLHEALDTGESHMHGLPIESEVPLVRKLFIEGDL